MHLLKSDVNTELIMDQKCEKGHKFADFVPRIAMTAFNIIAVNFVSDINDKIHEARKRSNTSTDETTPAKRKSVDKKKIAKLQSNKKV